MKDKDRLYVLKFDGDDPHANLFWSKDGDWDLLSNARVVTDTLRILLENKFPVDGTFIQLPTCVELFENGMPVKGKSYLTVEDRDKLVELISNYSVALDAGIDPATPERNIIINFIHSIPGI